MTLILSNDDVEHLLSRRECMAALKTPMPSSPGRGVSRLRSDSFAPIEG